MRNRVLDPTPGVQHHNQSTVTMDDETAMSTAEPDKPKVRLQDLLPAKWAVETSLGTLFVRWHTRLEFASFAAEPD
jgi:hypothetical protein